MHIHKGKNHLKKDKLEDFIGQKQNPNYKMGEPKRQVFFGASKDEVQNAIIEGELEQAAKSGLIGIGINAPNFEAMEKTTALRKAYNEKVTTLDEKYASLEPNSAFILRCFIYTGDEMVNPGSTIIVSGAQGLPKVPIKTRNGQAVWREVTDEFSYRGKAVIVAVPAVETDYKPGDIVQISTPRTMAPFPENDFIVVENAYLHPDSKHAEIPKNVEDEDFGYIIVSRSQIILRLQKANSGN